MAKTITVSNSTELYAALKASTGGETILLKEGSYGNFDLNVKSGFDLDLSGVKIASADPDSPAVFSGMMLTGVSNLTIDSVVFDYTFKAGDEPFLRPFAITGGSNIAITNSTFDGDVASGISTVADGYGYAYGLSVRASTDITIEGNEFYDFLRGAVFDGVDGLTVTGNDVHDLRSDGMNFVNVQDVLIEDNYFHDFRASYASGDHRDMIQFWTSGTTTPSTDITIRSNTFDIGDGSYTQSIFMRNEMVDTGRAGTEMYYQNVVIEDNTIYNGHLHGITVGETNGLVISNNSVLAVKDTHNPDNNDSNVWIPKINVSASSTNVQITSNATSGISGYSGQFGWVVTNNVYVQNTDPHADGFYGNIFVTSSLGDGVHSYVAMPGGLLDKLGAGSQQTSAIDTLTSEALYTVAQGEGGTRVFDASLTATLLGTADAGATYVWTFGDGTTAQGKVVSHSYTTGDSYDVTLKVITSSGRTLTADSTVLVAGSQVISYDPVTKTFVVHSGGTETNLSKLTSLDGGEIQLGASGTVASVDSRQLLPLRGSDDFAIDFSLQADKLGTAGEVFRLHGSFIATVNSSGSLSFQITGAKGTSLTLETAGVKLNDKVEHDISVQLDDGLLTIHVDGKLVAKGAFADTLPTSGSWDLSFGNPWGKANFAGDISEFGITVDADHYPDTPTTTVVEKDSGGLVTPEVPDSPTGGDPVLGQGESAIDSGSQSGSGTAGAAEQGHDSLSGGLALNIQSLQGSKSLIGAQVHSDGEQYVLTFDGDQDYVNLGRQTEYETSDRIAFSVDFTRSGDMVGQERLVWNHLKIGLTLEGDGLSVQVATADEGFKSFSVKNLGLSDTDLHNATVMLDAATDRLQVLLDGDVVMDVDGIDFDLDGVSDQQWGWSLGTVWNRYYEGEISDFHLSDQFEFLNNYTADPNALLI